MAVQVTGADEGDTASLPWTLIQSDLNLQAVSQDPRAKKHLHGQPMSEVVTDKGYHSNDTTKRLKGAKKFAATCPSPTAGAAGGRTGKPRPPCMPIDAGFEGPGAALCNGVAPNARNAVSLTPTKVEACDGLTCGATATSTSGRAFMALSIAPVKRADSPNHNSHS